MAAVTRLPELMYPFTGNNSYLYVFRPQSLGVKRGSETYIRHTTYLISDSEPTFCRNSRLSPIISVFDLLPRKSNTKVLRLHAT